MIKTTKSLMLFTVHYSIEEGRGQSIHRQPLNIYPRMYSAAFNSQNFFNRSPQLLSIKLFVSADETCVPVQINVPISTKQCFRSRSRLDPDSIRLVNLDPRSGIRIQKGKMTHKNTKKFKKFNVFVLNVLFWGLKAFPVAWTSGSEYLPGSVFS